MHLLHDDILGLFYLLRAYLPPRLYDAPFAQSPERPHPLGH